MYNNIFFKKKGVISMKKKLIIKIGCILILGTLLFPSVYANVYRTKAVDSENDRNIDSSIKEVVTITLETFDQDENDFKKDKIAELTITEAQIIKNELLRIEEEYESEEKIRKQIDLLHNAGLLPEYMILDDYITVLNRMKNIYDYNGYLPQAKVGYIFTGPSIMSTLAIGGQTYQLETLFGDILRYYFDITLLDIQNDNIFNGTHLHSSAYAGPVYVGFSPSASFITTLGLVFSGPEFIYSPFINIRVVFAGAHLSGTIFECANPIPIFDWHLNVALLGVVILQNNIQPATPYDIDGPKAGQTNKEYTFSTSTVDMEGDDIYYKFKWGDGTVSDWIGPYKNSEEVKTNHKYDKENKYDIKIRAKDSEGYKSDWSDEFTINIVNGKNKNFQKNNLYFYQIIQEFSFLDKIFLKLF